MHHGTSDESCCPDGCSISLAVVGATGAVGREVLAIAGARGFTPRRVRALASARSAGDLIPFAGEAIEVQELNEHSFDGCDVAIFAADADTARRYAPIARAAGVAVVDNSSAFRMDADVPLVVPEVNGDLLADLVCQGSVSGARAGDRDNAPLVANPNCTTIILVTALEPLRRAFGVEAIDVATYQAVSGAGQAAITELLDQTRGAGRARAGYPHERHPIDPAPCPSRVFAEPCAFNVFSHDSAIDPATGVNGEEQKVINETRKLWEQPELRVTPTCVRVPVLRAHTEAITVTLDRPATETEVRDALSSGCGVALLDDRPANQFPTPVKATGIDDVLIGRVRPDPGEAPDPARPDARRRWCLLVCADQLRKGAALNAIQIADAMGRLPEPRTATPALAG